MSNKSEDRVFTVRVGENKTYRDNWEQIDWTKEPLPGAKAPQHRDTAIYCECAECMCAREALAVVKALAED